MTSLKNVAEGASPEETAHRVVWAAVIRKDAKDERSGEWKPIMNHERSKHA